MGHALGLIGHTTDPSHLMYHTCDPEITNINTLTYDEICNLKLLYKVVLLNV
jgi:hypothetical protein